MGSPRTWWRISRGSANFSLRSAPSSGTMFWWLTTRPLTWVSSAPHLRSPTRPGRATTTPALCCCPAAATSLFPTHCPTSRRQPACRSSTTMTPSRTLGRAPVSCWISHAVQRHRLFRNWSPATVSGCPAWTPINQGFQNCPRLRGRRWNAGRPSAGRAGRTRG